MDLERLDPYDDSALAEVRALDDAAQAVDEPFNPPPTTRGYSGWHRYGWDGDPPQTFLLRRDGRLVGKINLNLPRRENTHLGSVGITVHPDSRRQGHGRALFEEAAGLVRAAGRRLVTTGTWDAPGLVAFAEAMGFAQASVEVERRQDLASVDRAEIAALRDKAAVAASDYTLLRIVDAVPDDLVDDVAVMSAAINDAPTDELEVDDEVFDAERIRGFEKAQAASGRTMYRLIARRGTDGPLAGHTIMAFDPEQPEWAGQFDTSVLKEHRGHRLGLLLKATMVDWISEVQPTVRWVDTWNAESNSHMIGVNEAIGYQIVARHIGWQRAV